VVRIDHAGHHLSAETILVGMALQERHGEPPEPAQVVAQGPLAGAAVVLPEVHVQHPVHRLDAPMAADRFAEPLAAERAAAEIMAHLVRLRAVGMLGDPYGEPIASTHGQSFLAAR
jgi:hypothetical protein